MDNKLCRLQFAGFLFTVTAGALLHFVFVAGGKSPILAAVASVNESTWEHMKLLFYPSFIYALAESLPLRRRYPGFWRAKLAGIAAGTALIPGLFYTLTGAFGKTPDWVNIALFFVAAAAEYSLETHILLASPAPIASFAAPAPCDPCPPSASCPPPEGKRPPRILLSPRAAFAILWILALAFALFTYFPPHVPLFLDPVTGAYGLG